MTVDEFFYGRNSSKYLFDCIHAMVNGIGPAEIRVTKSQVVFRRRKPFAWVWMPGKYLHGKVAPLVLTFVFDHRDPLLRWKEIVEPSPGHFTHHLELYSKSDIDDQVSAWLQYAWSMAA